MAGRGRGGGGRGRGRGMSFDPRDMGFGASEQLPAPVLQPPPVFPPLDFQPASMHSTPEMEYMVALKKDFTIFLKDHFNLSEKGEELKSIDTLVDWNAMPAELKARKKKPVSGKKRVAKSSPARTKKANYDLNALDALAKLEDNPQEVEGEKEGETEEKGEGEEEEKEEEDELEDLDEEMDDGTDYVNNYFDNGEGFDDDDDNGNDGPIY